MTTYIQESWRSCWAEMAPLWRLHWEEVAINRDVIQLDPDTDEYQRIEDRGILQVIVARDIGRIVGYHISFVRPHLHYKQDIHAFVDVYYVLPKVRERPLVAHRLFEQAEKRWRARKVIKAFTGTKTWLISNVTGKSLDVGPLLEFQGWTKTETAYTKVLNYA